VEGLAVVSGFLAPWTSAFAVSVGLLALCLFAYLAAVYLTHEAGGGELQEDFRHRALAAGGAVFVAAFGVLGLAHDGAPRVWAGLIHAPFALAVHGATALAALAAFGFLWARRFLWARVAAALQGALIVLGWAASQYPYLVVPDVTLEGAAASANVQRLLLGALGVGVLVVVPSLVLLLRTFQRRAPAA
jgi:cytochrome d ubiquinol oxidase subunit II